MILEIRQLLPVDAAAYRELMLEAYSRHPEAFTATVEERQDLPLAFWEQRTAQVQGAFAAGKLVGAAGLEPDRRPKTRHRAKLFGMYVRAESRGRGAGRRLVEAILAEARARPGLEVVYLSVTDSNEEARRLYERCGFRQYGHEPMAILEAGVYLGKLHLWRPCAGWLHPSGPAPVGEA